VLATIARRIGGTPGQVIFKWAHAKGLVVVTTTERRTRLDEYLAVVHLRAFPSPPLPHSKQFWLTDPPRAIADLTQDEIEAIDKAGALGPPSPALVRAWEMVRTALARRAALGTMVVLLIVLFLHRLGWLALPCAH